MKNYKIHLIRHGLTQENIDGLYCGRTDTSLCPDGKEQIKKMKEDYIYPQADFVFSSPLKRCLETAEIIYPGIKPLVFDDLIEYNFGEFENQSAEKLHSSQPLFDRWLRGEPGVTPPFGESNEEFAKRVCECFVKICDGILKAGTDNIAIITHGGVISTILSQFAIPEADISDWMMPCGCGYTVHLSHFLWMSGHKVEAMKEIPELPEEQKKGNYYDGWDYYPDDDDFDISEYLYD